MKKNVSFEKTIEFPTMIGEVSAISLEKELQFVDASTVEGYFLLSGKYKITEASRIEESFNYKIPAEIHFTESLDLNSTDIEISNFSYSITDGNTMNCEIELTIEGSEIIIQEELTDEKDDNRECDGDLDKNKEIEIPTLEVDNLEVDNSEDELDNSGQSNIIFNIDDDKDTFGTFVVYIVRQNESINTILEKYHTSLEEVEKYNDINNISIGSKLIIPLLHE